MFHQHPSVGNNKQVCNFYLKGTCKYGIRCWNLHPQDQGGTGMTNAFPGNSAGNMFIGKASTQQDTKEFQDFVKQVSGEMNMWERSGQWLFSCFFPLKGCHPLMGFSDHSLEELRVRAYDAVKTNTSSTYQAHWSELQQRYKQLRDALKMSTPEAVQAMRDIHQAKSAVEQQEQQQALKPSSLFSKPPGQTLFGGATPQSGSGVGLLGAKPPPLGYAPSVFGGNSSSSTSLFSGGGNTPVFGVQSSLGAQNTTGFGNQSSNIFGGASSNVFKSGTQNATNTNLFGALQGQTNSSTLFGGSTSTSTTGQTPGNVFGSVQNQAGVNIVYNSNAQNQPSLFGGTGTSVPGSGFQATQATNSTGVSNTVGGQGGIFGNQQQPQQQGLFGAQPTQQQASVFCKPNVFGVNQPSASVQNTSHIFGGSSGSSIFGTNAIKGSPNIFGGNAPAGGGNGLFGNVQAAGPFSNPSGVFGNTNELSTNTRLFGKPSEVTQPTVVQGTPGLFGHPATGASSSVSSPAVVQGNSLELYTPLDQLKPEDRIQFEAEAFTSIPYCPPPKELCA
ncbi:nucleoporin NUP42-like [Homarus americanus]|uniref:nucleoporin NUP42-like n=1 Tax=Homarus americanus TaxID=6706 RepID=UPI001C475301|nr:nucleoporin NUP42-like [Homarus americanus]XP_042236590.1 nucleoporin NUP42-like [Homarus americanus]XP_042236591.1 nucleoporin NUP42-like [Homarus americanus]XP_042236592.1 nucleoporin NUP42-like [Homarus americanus]